MSQSPKWQLQIASFVKPRGQDPNTLHLVLSITNTLTKVLSQFLKKLCKKLKQLKVQSSFLRYKT